MESGKSWPGLPGPVGMFKGVRSVVQPPEGDGSLDLVFEPTRLFFVLAIDAEEIGIGLLEELFAYACSKQ
jgi:hypothetical protein